MWKTVKLGDVCDFQGGSQPPKKEFVFEPQEGYVRFLQIRDFKSDKNVTYIPIAKKNRLCNTDDILIGRYGASVGQILRGLGGAYNVALMKTIPNEELISKGWLYAYLNSPLFQKPLMEVSSRSAQNGFSKDDISAFELPLPPLAEQQRIVAKLDAAFAEIDRAIEIAIEKQKQSEQLADTALDEIANLEGESVTLAQVCSIEAALVSPIENPYRHQKHIGAGNIISFSNQLVDVMTAEEEKLTSGKYPFNESSVLYSKIRPYLRKVHLPEFEGICSADMYPLVPNKEKLTREYLFYLLLSNHFTNYAITGSARAGMPKVNRNHLFAYQFSLPNVTTQKAFSQKMEKILTQTRNLNAFYQSQIDKLAALKSAILTQELQPPQSEAA